MLASSRVGTLLTNSLNAKLLAWSAVAGLPALSLSKLRGLSAQAQATSSIIDVPKPIQVLIADSVTHVFLLSITVVIVALFATVVFSLFLIKRLNITSATRS